MPSHTPEQRPGSGEQPVVSQPGETGGHHHRQGWRQPERERGPGQCHQLQRRWPEYQCRQCGQRQSAGGRKQPVTFNASTSFASLFTSSFGADGAGTLVYSLNVSAAGADKRAQRHRDRSGHPALSGEWQRGRPGGWQQRQWWPFTPSVNSSGEVTLDQERAIAHTPNSGPDQRAACFSQPGETGGHHHRQGWRQPERERGPGQCHQLQRRWPEISAGSAANDSLQVDESNLSPMPAPALQPVHQQLWRRWGRHPGLPQPECQCCRGR